MNLVPFWLMAEWRERFLEAEKATLRKQAAREDGENKEIVRSRYGGLALRPPEETRKRDSFLDDLSRLFGDLPSSS